MHATPSTDPRASTGFWQLAAGAVLLSFAPVFVKLAGVGPAAAGFYRMAVGAIVLLALALVRGERLWAGQRALLFTLAAGFCFALDLVFWHRSIQLVGPGLATILANFQVFLLAGFGVLVLREPAHWRLSLAIPVALVGLFLLVGIDWTALSPTYRAGVALGLLTAASYGAFLLVLRASQTRAGRLEPVPNLMLICVATTAFLAATVLLEGETLRVPDVRTGLILVVYGVTAQVVGWLLISRGIPRVEAGRAGLILLLQPSLAFVWDMLFFRRPTGVADVMGAALALVAIYLGAAPRRRRPDAAGR